MKEVTLQSKWDPPARSPFMAAGVRTLKPASERRRPRHQRDARRAPAVGRSLRPAVIRQHPDFSLIHDVQIRATGANIHAVAQQLQIYVSATECGALRSAQAAEAHLRTFLASGRVTPLLLAEPLRADDFGICRSGIGGWA